MPPNTVTIAEITFTYEQDEEGETWYTHAHGLTWWAFRTKPCPLPGPFQGKQWWSGGVAQPGPKTPCASLTGRINNADGTGLRQDPLYDKVDHGTTNPPRRLLTAIAAMIHARLDPWTATTADVQAALAALQETEPAKPQQLRIEFSPQS